MERLLTPLTAALRDSCRLIAALRETEDDGPLPHLRLATALRRHAALLEAAAADLELEAHEDLAKFAVAAVDLAATSTTPELAAERVADAFLSLAARDDELPP